MNILYFIHDNFSNYKILKMSKHTFLKESKDKTWSEFQNWVTSQMAYYNIYLLSILVQGMYGVMLSFQIHQVQPLSFCQVFYGLPSG